MCINSVKETGSRASNEVVSRANLGIAVIPSLLTGMGRRLAQPRSPHPVNWEPIIPCANFVSLFDFLGPFLLIFFAFWTELRRFARDILGPSTGLHWPSSFRWEGRAHPCRPTLAREPYSVILVT